MEAPCIVMTIAGFAAASKRRALRPLHQRLAPENSEPNRPGKPKKGKRISTAPHTILEYRSSGKKGEHDQRSREELDILRSTVFGGSARHGEILARSVDTDQVGTKLRDCVRREKFAASGLSVSRQHRAARGK